MVLTSYQGETPDHEQTWTPNFITGPTRNDSLMIKLNCIIVPHDCQYVTLGAFKSSFLFVVLPISIGFVWLVQCFTLAFPLTTQKTKENPFQITVCYQFPLS